MCVCCARRRARGHAPPARRWRRLHPRTRAWRGAAPECRAAPSARARVAIGASRHPRAAPTPRAHGLALLGSGGEPTNTAAGENLPGASAQAGEPPRGAALRGAGLASARGAAHPQNHPHRPSNAQLGGRAAVGSAKRRQLLGWRRPAGTLGSKARPRRAAPSRQSRGEEGGRGRGTHRT